MTEPWHPLPFDSDFFGFGIGRVDLDAVDTADVAAIEAEARAAGIVCLFGLLATTDPEESYRLQEIGWRFVDTAARYEVPLSAPLDDVEADCTVRRGTRDDVDAVRESVLTMAPWSRFAADPRFGLDAARRMHMAWVHRAVDCTTGEHELTVAEGPDGIVAFLTRTRGERPLITTVGTITPGNGAARALFAESREWALPDPVSAGWAASRNVAVHRFLVRCGFLLAENRYHFHRWLDDPPRVHR